MGSDVSLEGRQDRRRIIRRFGLALLLTLLSGCGGITAGQPAATQTALKSVSAILDTERLWYPAPGAVAVVRVGSRQWFGSSGAADLVGTPITANTRFRIASITKPIVATLVLEEVVQGRLSLEADVAGILPNVLRPGPTVTVRMLLNHTSGIFDETNDATDVTGDVLRLSDPALKAEAMALVSRINAGEHVIAPDRLIVALAETHDRYFAPGGGFHYSNVNYQLAAMILERVTGQSLPEILQTGITGALGLRQTTIAPPDTASPELRGYDSSGTGQPLIDSTDDLIAFGNGGNGGVISTAGELLTIMQALLAGKLIPQSLLAEMQNPTVQSMQTGWPYGLGLQTYHLSCGTFYGHGGSVLGTMSIAIASADGLAGVVVAVNLRGQKDPQLQALAEQLVCPRL